MKSLTNASHVNTALQVIQHINNIMTAAEISLGYNMPKTAYVNSD